MKIVIIRALFRAATSFVIIFVLVTVLQYVAWHQTRQDLIVYIDYPDSAAGHNEIHNNEGIFCPWFLNFWPFNRPTDRGW